MAREDLDVRLPRAALVPRTPWADMSGAVGAETGSAVAPMRLPSCGPLLWFPSSECRFLNTGMCALFSNLQFGLYSGLNQ